MAPIFPRLSAPIGWKTGECPTAEACLMEFAGSAFEIKQLDDAGRIEGLAAAFGNVDHGGDRMLAGSVTKTLAERGNRPLPMLLHHDLKRPIGAWKEWHETADGLFVKGAISLATRDGAEAHALAREGALTGISIGYVPRQKSYDGSARVLEAVDLHEASLVAVPMNDLARVTAVKSITGARDIAELLQDAGLSGRKAKAAAGAAWKAINDSNDDAEAEAEIRAILNSSAARIAAIGGSK
jgi:HK97 family phage prohead protease